MQTKAKYDFTDKVVVITGAVNGIGKSIAEKYYEDGANVVLADIDAEKGMQMALNQGSRSVFVQCDISDPTRVSQLFETTLSQFGRLDILVNNAGVNSIKPQDRVAIDSYADETWLRMINIDLNGTFYCCKEAAKVMSLQHSGSIVNIASVAGIVALRLQVGFVAAKAAVLRMTEAMACELGPIGIRVNAVSPGSIITETTKQLFYSNASSFSEMAARLVSFIPQGRPGEASEISEAVQFLTSDSASYINGHNLVVDGGWTCGFNRDF